MEDIQLKKLIEEQIDVFINNIARELESSHDHWFESFGFPIFGETSKEYHEQVYFQSYLESYTRKMINTILRDMCDEETADKIHWPELEYNGIYNGHTNTEYEKDFGFEFINEDQKIGYRYTFIEPDAIDQLIEKGKVETIVIVQWQWENDPVSNHYSDPRVKTILLWDLFQELFCELNSEEIRMMYSLFTNRISNAVTHANSMISLVTLPGFTPSYIYKTREKVIADLQEEVSRLLAFSVNNIDYKNNETDSRSLITVYNLPEYFLKMHMEQAFVGFSDYAKSYLTSEYLYRYFNGNTLFDYTPIVSGYIKSIEQLLHFICTRYRNSQHVQVNMSQYTLGKYVEYLNSHDGILRTALRPAKDIIVRCLDSYRVESRNHLFHKDYLNSWGRVEQIRKNTIFLYTALLGAVDTSLITDNQRIIGSLNVDYDRLFHILDDKDESMFILIFNGIEYTGMRKQHRNQGLVFNVNGLIKNPIAFKRFVYDHYEEIEITRTNMPSEIWTVDHHGKKRTKIWPTT